MYLAMSRQQTFVQQKMSDKHGHLRCYWTLSDQQILYNNVGTFSPGLILCSACTKIMKIEERNQLLETTSSCSKQRENVALIKWDVVIFLDIVPEQFLAALPRKGYLNVPYWFQYYFNRNGCRTIFYRCFSYLVSLSKLGEKRMRKQDFTI